MSRASTVAPFALLLLVGGIAGCADEPCGCPKAAAGGCADGSVGFRDAASPADGTAADGAEPADLGSSAPPDGDAVDGSSTDSGAHPDDGSRADGSGSVDSGDAGAAPLLQEREPNGGATPEEFNELPVGAGLRGAVGSPGDADLFHVSTLPGRVYDAWLEVPAGSPLLGHLTAIDDGRGGDAAGEDYVKLARSPDGPDARLSWLAMGAGGYFVAVRDERGVGAAGPGGPAYAYTLRVVEQSPREAGVLELGRPGEAQGQLPHAGGVSLHSFEAAQGDEVRFDLQALPRGAFDGRLLVWSEATGDWVARNDNRAVDDLDPLIATPLTADGPWLLVVDNIEETPAGLSYRLVSGP